MKLWYLRISDSESCRAYSPDCPGDGWQELERDLEPGEVVDVSDGVARIRAAEALPSSRGMSVPDRSAYRQAVAQALPDILLAVADGADLATEVRKVLESLKPEDQSGTPV